MGKYFKRIIKKALEKCDPLPSKEQEPNKDNGKEGIIDRDVEFWFSCFLLFFSVKIIIFIVITNVIVIVTVSVIVVFTVYVISIVTLTMAITMARCHGHHCCHCY